MQCRGLPSYAQGLQREKLRYRPRKCTVRTSVGAGVSLAKEKDADLYGQAVGGGLAGG